MKIELLLKLTMPVFLLFLCTPILSSAVAADNSPYLEYTVGKCEQNLAARSTSPSERINEEPPIKQITGAVNIRHDESFYCAADFSVTMSQNENLLKLLISESSEVFAECVCSYHIDMHIFNLPSGSYKIEIWGVENKKLDAPELEQSLKAEIDSNGEILLQDSLLDYRLNNM